MKRILMISVAILMSLSFVGCKEEPVHYDGWEGWDSFTKSMVVFDEKEFSPDEAYATVYFGTNYDPIIWDNLSRFYAYAFFIHETLDEYKEDMWGEGIRYDFPRATSLFEEILSKPVNEMSEISNLEKPVFMVHHKERGNENYFLSYDLIEEYKKNVGILKKLEFKYWRRVKLPPEFFEEDKGDFTFIYETMNQMGTSELYEASFAMGREEVRGHYKKKKGKIVLDDKILLEEKFRDVQILNLEE